MDRNNLSDVHQRIQRVAEDLREIQRELNCAAMEAPGDPELMELLNDLPELESLQTLKSALDQMRHFLWFYTQVVMNESEAGDEMRASIQQKPMEVVFNSDTATTDRLRSAVDLALLTYMIQGKDRKPN
jgi:hypothetical protein